MTKIGNMQKIMISLDIYAEEKSFLNWPENLPVKYQVGVSGHPVYIYRKSLETVKYLENETFLRKMFPTKVVGFQKIYLLAL